MMLLESSNDVSNPFNMKQTDVLIWGFAMYEIKLMIKQQNISIYIGDWAIPIAK